MRTHARPRSWTRAVVPESHRARPQAARPSSAHPTTAGGAPTEGRGGVPENKPAPVWKTFFRGQTRQTRMGSGPGGGQVAHCPGLCTQMPTCLGSMGLGQACLSPPAPRPLPPPGLRPVPGRSDDAAALLPGRRPSACYQTLRPPPRSCRQTMGLRRSARAGVRAALCSWPEDHPHPPHTHSRLSLGTAALKARQAHDREPLGAR